MSDFLKCWYCDNCGKTIDNVENGYVIWKCDTELKQYDFKIIHSDICDNDKNKDSMHLKHFIGINGLAYLTTFLSFGIISNHKTPSKISDIDNFIDFFRRVQLPYYEEARRKFHNNSIKEKFSGYNEFKPYTTEILKNISDGEYD